MAAGPASTTRGSRSWTSPRSSDRAHPPEQIILSYPSLNLAQVYAAISYYYENRNEVEAEIAEDEGWDEEHGRRKGEYLRAAR